MLFMSYEVLYKCQYFLYSFILGNKSVTQRMYFFCLHKCFVCVCAFLIWHSYSVDPLGLKNLRVSLNSVRIKVVVWSWTSHITSMSLCFLTQMIDGSLELWLCCDLHYMKRSNYFQRTGKYLFSTTPVTLVL